MITLSRGFSMSKTISIRAVQVLKNRYVEKRHQVLELLRYWRNAKLSSTDVMISIEDYTSAFGGPVFSNDNGKQLLTVQKKDLLKSLREIYELQKTITPSIIQATALHKIASKVGLNHYFKCPSQ